MLYRMLLPLSIMAIQCFVCCALPYCAARVTILLNEASVGRHPSHPLSDSGSEFDPSWSVVRECTVVVLCVCVSCTGTSCEDADAKDTDAAGAEDETEGETDEADERGDFADKERDMAAHIETSLCA